MKVLFLDESGDHNLEVIDPLYPLFVLGGVILEKDYAEGDLVERLDAFKRKLFGRTDLVLHTADITRNKNGFERLKDTAFRTEFYLQLNQLMRELSYKVVGCAIRKDEHMTRYGLSALDPYLLSLNVLVERFCFEVGNFPAGGVIVAEKRGITLDHELEIAWLNLKVGGTKFMSGQKVERRLIGLNLRSKAENIAGLQLADLVVSPIGRHILGKPPKEDFQIIESKMRRDSSGSYDGHGLVVLPRDSGKKKEPAPATQLPAHKQQ